MNSDQPFYLDSLVENLRLAAGAFPQTHPAQSMMGGANAVDTLGAEQTWSHFRDGQFSPEQLARVGAHAARAHKWLGLPLEYTGTDPKYVTVPAHSRAQRFGDRNIAEILSTSLKPVKYATSNYAEAMLGPSDPDDPQDYPAQLFDGTHEREVAALSVLWKAAAHAVVSRETGLARRELRQAIRYAVQHHLYDDSYKNRLRDAGTIANAQLTFVALRFARAAKPQAERVLERPLSEDCVPLLIDDLTYGALGTRLKMNARRRFDSL